MKKLLVKSTDRQATGSTSKGTATTVNEIRLLTKSPNRVGKPRTLVFGAFAALFVAIASILLFYGCKKDNSLIPVEKGMITQAEKDEIDNLSLEIVQFHDYAIRKFLDDLYVSGDIFNNEYYLKICESLKQSVDEYSFSYLKREELKNVSFTYDEIQKMMEAGDSLDFPMCTCENFKPDVKIVKSKCQRIEDIFSVLLEEANTFDKFEDFKIQYTYLVNEELASIDNIETYIPIRFFADMYIGSFETWASYLYNDDNHKRQKAWTDIVNKAKEVWTTIKPAVVADAAGAGVGAMAGACAGGVGAGPGAAIGAIGSSAGKAIETILSK